MANIWKANKDVNNHPNRNNFDLSFQNHLTMKMGALYPVFCKRVVPGDSLRINTAFGLKFMPMVFPVQSRMRAHMHYFYVRNKNLWKNWENWISGLVTNDEHPHPYLDVDDSKVETGSIHDFLGVPTTVVTHDSISSSASFILPETHHDIGYNDFYNKGVSSPLETVSSVDDCSFIGILSSPFASSGVLKVTLSKELRTLFLGQFNDVAQSWCTLYVLSVDYFGRDDAPVYRILDSVNFPDQNFTLNLNSYSSHPNLAIAVAITKANFGYGSIQSLADFSNSFAVLTYVSSAGFYEYKNLGFHLYSNDEHLNALPYRAYESIYHAYYANSVLQPLRDGDDKPVYNEYNTTTDDGADATDYHLFQRNYELDPYTSAMPSPQQGIAPLVGMTALGDVTIEDENGITTAKAEIDNDGTISKVVLTSPAASVEHARTAMNIAAAGLSINDFRAGNALQRLLETSLRKGYRYMDFIAGHFGKEPEYRELDMPEFIGGFSRDVIVSTTFASADTAVYDEHGDLESGANLGDYVGNASLFGGSQHSVSHYCDDYGWIIGILCVTPTPAYSQILQKQMMAPSNYLDYMFPEMNTLGLQPITYEEMTPIQRYAEMLSDPDKKLQDTFGYQRIYHDYVSSIDELHGEFRGSMKNYLVNRIFAESPELGDEFIKINPEEINDIFVNTTPTDDTIIGQIIFDVKAKRPINRIVIPGLGR